MLATYFNTLLNHKRPQPLTECSSSKITSRTLWVRFLQVRSSYFLRVPILLFFFHSVSFCSEWYQQDLADLPFRECSGAVKPREQGGGGLEMGTETETKGD